LTDVERKEIAELELLQKHGGDQSTELLLLAKKAEWDNVRNSIATFQQLDLTLADQDGYTPLLLAVKAGKTDIVEKMVEKGADLYATSKVLQNPLKSEVVNIFSFF
jgi:ankyrin repeat protein